MGLRALSLRRSFVETCAACRSPELFYQRITTATSKRSISGGLHEVAATRLNGKSEHELLLRTRNIGIIAHIDAGKTTTTERMLYYSGLTSTMGEVHDGDTITDYMPQERERGITITSAVASFPWRKHRINLIDTPGHVDFTVEVERALTVLDGAIVVLDASAGVEAQTTTVWSQADRYELPRIVYLNKMDKQGADVAMCLKSIRKLDANPVLIHLPVRSEADKFIGLVDIVSLEKTVWDTSASSDGSGFTMTRLSDKKSTGDIDNVLYDTACKMRDELIGSLCELDEQLAEVVLANEHIDSLSPDVIYNSLRRATIKQNLLPVICGSSYKNTGVQNLMDSILRLLPSPLETKQTNAVTYYGDKFCGLAFKVIHDHILGALTFIRVYSGVLKPLSKIYNVNRSQTEKVNKLYSVLANEYKEVLVCTRGSIVIVTGLQICVTGDTLVASQDVAEHVSREQ